MRKIGLILTFPEGKKAGYYAQVVKAIAENVQLFDRDKELIVLSGAGDRDRATAVLDKYRIPAEEIGLMLLPEGTELPPAAEEYGFETRAGRTFLYEDRTAGFVLGASAAAEGGASEADRRAAWMQLAEHVVLSFTADDGRIVHVCEPHLKETVEGIASRYRVGAEFLW